MSAQTRLTRKAKNGEWVWEGTSFEANESFATEVFAYLQHLRVCPFCKKLKQEVVEEDGLYYVFCYSCSSMGPEHPNLLTALRLWQGEAEGDHANASNEECRGTDCG